MFLSVFMTNDLVSCEQWCPAGWLDKRMMLACSLTGDPWQDKASKVCACYAERGNRRAETLPWNLDLRHVASIFRQDSHTRLTDAVFPSIQLNSGIVVADSGTFSVWPPSRSLAQCPGHIRDPLPFLLWMGLTWCNACSDVSVVGREVG